MTSERLNADALEDPDDEDLLFDNLSGPMEIPELHFPKLKFHFLPLDHSGEDVANNEPDFIIKAFA
jgi:hypothetical protein